LETIHAILQAQLGVFFGDDALDDELHLGGVAHLLDEVPRHIA
jgi:hypothetical protein